MNNPAQTSEILHATSIAVEGRAALILGASGAGKSSLALQLIGLGAQLIADDKTIVTLSNGGLIASPPATIAGMIEARGIGILKLPFLQKVPVSLAIDLDKEETERLPHSHDTSVLGIKIPCLRHAPSPHFSSAILLYLKSDVGEHIR